MTLSIARFIPVLLFLNFLVVSPAKSQLRLTPIQSSLKSDIPETRMTDSAGFQKPAYLYAQVDENDVKLSWGMDSLAGNWLTYEQSSPAFSVGLNSPGVFSVASRWPAETLTDYTGKPVTKFAFFPTSDVTIYTLKILKGENLQTLVYTQALTNLVFEQLNEIELNSLVTLEQDEDYWFSIEYQQLTSNIYPAAVDNGPAVAGLGDMINLGNGWESLSNFGLDVNWSISVFVADNGSESTMLPVSVDDKVKNGPLSLLSPQLKPAANSGKETFLGFNIYRNGIKLNSSVVTEQFFNDPDLAAGIYTYGVTAVYIEGESLPVEKTVQVASGQLDIFPDLIDITLTANPNDTVPLTMTNSYELPISWQVDSLPAWLNLPIMNGIIDPSGLQVIDLIIDGTGLSGTNTFIIQFLTSDVVNPVVLLPVTVNAAANGLLCWSINPLDFGTIPILETKIQIVSLVNMSDATTFINGISLSSQDFFVSVTDWSIPANSSIEIPVYFLPSTSGTFAGTLFVSYFNYLGSFTTELLLVGEAIILPPTGLTATTTENEVTLNWLPPGFNPDALTFTNGEPLFVIGTSGPGKYEFAHRFTSSDLMPYSGKLLEQVSFYVYSVNSDFEVKIYIDEFAETPLITMPVSGLTSDSWNTFGLPEPLSLDQLEYLWIGYQIEVNDLEFIGVVDGGPGITGSGDLVKIGETPWTTLSEFQLPYNWCIKGILNDSQVVGFWPNEPGNQITLANNFLGYNVYKDGVKITETPILVNTFTDEIVNGESWIYGVTTVYESGESLPAEISVSATASIVMPDGWDFTASSRVHTIHIPSYAIQAGLNLQNGDMIGVFYSENGVEKCAGALEWSGEQTIMKAFGDSPETPWKDGFLQDETISWKVFFNQSQTTYPLSVTYSTQMPHHDGSFKMMGLSMLESLELGTVSVEEADVFTQNIGLFPNPSKGIVSLNGLNSGDLVTVYDTNGRAILSYFAGSPLSQFTINRAGLYLVEIKGERDVTRKKLVIR